MPFLLNLKPYEFICSLYWSCKIQSSCKINCRLVQHKLQTNSTKITDQQSTNCRPIQHKLQKSLAQQFITKCRAIENKMQTNLYTVSSRPKSQFHNHSSSTLGIKHPNQVRKGKMNINCNLTHLFS